MALPHDETTVNDAAPRNARYAEFVQSSAEQAEQRLADVRQRLRRMRIAAATAHEGAANAHDDAAALGIGDVEAHLRAAARHRAARDADLRAAENGD